MKLEHYPILWSELSDVDYIICKDIYDTLNSSRNRENCCKALTQIVAKGAAYQEDYVCQLCEYFPEAYDEDIRDYISNAGQVKAKVFMQWLHTNIN